MFFIIIYELTASSIASLNIIIKPYICVRIRLILILIYLTILLLAPFNFYQTCSFIKKIQFDSFLLPIHLYILPLLHIYLIFLIHSKFNFQYIFSSPRSILQPSFTFNNSSFFYSIPSLEYTRIIYKIHSISNIHQY